ncbi:hypothetical protein [Kaistella carnis]|uniref:hypothetical protein n=1 Tax=Kaistella carnis TaxID=1241979 RepID=UPI0028A2A0FE|nr:hypothetical protein [Kaistella carnis]
MNAKNKEEERFLYIKRKNFDSLIQLKVPLKELEKDYVNYPVTFGNIKQLQDFIWFQFQKNVERHCNNFEVQHQTFLAMVEFKVVFENKTDNYHIKKLANDAFKMSHQNTFAINGFMMEAVISAHKNSCPTCLIDDGRVLSETEFFTNDVLPHKDCTCPGIGCICVFGFRGVRDQTGQLIYQELDIKDEKQRENGFSNKSLQREGAKSLLNFFKFFSKKK